MRAFSFLVGETEAGCKFRTAVCNPDCTLKTCSVLRPMPKRKSCGPGDPNGGGGHGRETQTRNQSKEGQDGGAGARELRPPQVTGKV